MDYYEALGVNEDATQEQIKAAYRTLAKKYHPDVNDAQNAAAVFRLIQEAYETLGDLQKRKEYDNGYIYGREEYNSDIEDAQSYSDHYTYEPYDAPSQPERRKDIPIIDSLLAIAAISATLNQLVHIHLAISLLLGIAFSVLLAGFFQTRMGWWVISVIYSLIWALLFCLIAIGYLTRDWIWLITIAVVTFFISLMKHRHKTKEK